MKEFYQVVLHSQLGPREGRLCLSRTGSSVFGTLALAGYENPVQGTWDDGAHTLTLAHCLRTAVGNHACRSVLTVSGSHLSGVAELAGCKMTWSGERLSGEDGREVHCE